jgi:hypothetical protein
MPDKKISALTELAAIDVDSDDELAIVDKSIPETKRITIASLITALFSGVELGDLGDVVGSPDNLHILLGNGDEWFSVDYLTGLFPTLTGNAGKLLKLNANADGLEWTDPSAVTLGKTVVGYFPAQSLKPSTTAGSANLAWVETTNNDVMYGHLAFDAASIEHAQFSFRAPNAYDESAGFTASFEWVSGVGATSFDCVWQIEMQAQGDTDTLDSAWGTAVTVTDTATAGTRRVTSETATITPSGTWQAGDTIIVRVSRLATSGSDTLNVDALLLGINLFATLNSLVEA